MKKQEEHDLLRKLDDLAEQRREILNELDEKRRNRAKEIRRLYFKERKTQKSICADFGLAQGSVSRIISGQVWEERSYG